MSVAPVSAADLERADVASARAAQWTERAEVPKAKAPPTGADEFEKQLEAGNVNEFTHAFLADLLEE